MMQRVRVAWLILLLAAAVPAGAGTPPTTSGNLAMGMPSPATSDPSNKNDFLMDRPFFAESFNDAKGFPNWVAWRLIPSDIGHAPRVKFFADPDLPASFKHVQPADYTGEGFDRGH